MIRSVFPGKTLLFQLILSVRFLKVEDKESPEFAFRPLFYLKKNRPAGSLSLDILYPFFHYKQNNDGYRAGFLFNLLSFGNKVQSGAREKTFRLYPLFFHRSSDIPERRQFAFAPFYGNFGGKTKFVLFPLYLRTSSGKGVTHNVLWPFFAFYSGERKGFRFWPFFGRVEQKKYRMKFVMWPLYFDREVGAGASYSRYKAFFPFYYRFDYKTQSNKIYLWPLFQKSTDPANNLDSLHLPWPFVNFKKSDDGTRTRFFPLFEKSEIPGVKKTRFFLWPLYTSSRIKLSSYYYKKDSVLIIFKIRREKPFDGRRASSLKVDLWPVFSYRKDEKGRSYFHMLSLFEPFIGSSEKLYRNYAFLWRVLEVRRKKNVGTSVSLLFGILNFKKTCEEKSFYIAGKAFGYYSGSEGRKIRFLFLPVKIGSPQSGRNCSG